MPSIEPEQIKLNPHLPENVSLVASIQNTNGMFIAEKSLWNSLVNDFSKVYFFGGKAVFYNEFKGMNGNTYKYALFNWRDQNNIYDKWFSSFADKKAAARKYTQTMDMFYQYYSDHITPLPAHNILITDQIRGNGLPQVASRGNFYDYMQLWSEKENIGKIAHHVFHAYIFDNVWNAKLNVGTDHFLSEGLPMYFEHTVPGLLFGDDYFMGRLYGLLMLDRRGEGFGIKNNQFHQRYNESVLRIYLFDEAIKKAIGGEKAYINGSEYILDAPPVLSSGKTIVPLRFISEATGCKVYWYDTVKTVLIERE